MELKIEEDRMKSVFESQGLSAQRLRSSTARERIAKIKKLRDVMLSKREDIYAACFADFKKPQGEVD